MPRCEDIEEERWFLKEKLDRVRGWLSIDEGMHLSNLAKDIDTDLHIVEIGSFHGRSTICLAQGSAEGNHAPVITVDPHQGIECYGNNISYDMLTKNLESNNLGSIVDICVDTSTSVAKKWNEKKIGLLFIDALHDYESVNNDLLSWLPYLKEGSFIVFHDSVQTGVNRLVLELLNRGRDFKPLGLRDSLFVFRKSSDIDEKRNSFFIKLLEKRGQEHLKWLERDSFIIHNSCLSFLKGLTIR